MADPSSWGNPSTSRGPFNPGSFFIVIYDENDPGLKNEPGLNGPLDVEGLPQLEGSAICVWGNDMKPCRGFCRRR